MDQDGSGDPASRNLLEERGTPDESRGRAFDDGEMVTLPEGHLPVASHTDFNNATIWETSGILKSDTRLLRIMQFLAVPVLPRLVIAVVLALSFIKLLLVPSFYHLDIPVSEILFGFGPAAHAVATTGSMVACPPLFLDLPGLECAFAERMPLMPYIFAAAIKLVGDSALRLAILKTALLDLLLLYFLWRWLVIIGADRFTLMLIALVFVGPQFMLHSFSPHYEEGFLIQLLALLLIIQFAYVWGRENELARWAQLPVYIAVSAAIYLLKSSMILVFAWSFVFLITLMRLRTPVRLAAAVAMCLPLLLWGGFVKHMTGRFAIGTSIDGWNLLLGNNSATLDFYPRYTVDILHGDGPIELEGRMIDRVKLADLDPQLEQEVWTNEWQANDAYRNIAIAWALGHVSEELRLVAWKLEVFFLDVRNNSIVPGHDKPPVVALVAGMGWMAAMRVIMWSAIATAALAVWRGTVMRSAGLCFLTLLVLYAAPCIVGYAYERHVVPIMLLAALFLASAWRLRPLNRVASQMQDQSSIR
jgi:hypothetical protein